MIETTDERMKMKAIPTRYAGVIFRSRLEARWAAFFDLAGIQWDYEPFDLDGWTPDFVLHGDVPILAEVKPVPLVRSFPNDRLAMIASSSFDKAAAHRTSHWVVRLGIGPQSDSDFFGIGHLMDMDDCYSKWADAHKILEVKDERRLWREAGNAVQWRPKA